MTSSTRNQKLKTFENRLSIMQNLISLLLLV